MNRSQTNAPGPSEIDWNEGYSGEQGDYMAPDPLVLELASALTPGDVLDVGCGAGGLLVALGQRGWRAHGIDLAARAIEAATKIMEARGVEATLAVADASRWRPSRTYDLVTNTFALPVERAEQAQVCRMIREAVAPGGTVIVKDFDAGMHRIDAFRGCDLVELPDLLEAFAGFEILRGEIVATPVHDHSESPDRPGGGPGAERTSPWTAALLVARRPL